MGKAMISIFVAFLALCAHARKVPPTKPQQFVCVDYNRTSCEEQLQIVGKDQCRMNPFFGVLECCATCSKALHSQIVIEQPSQIRKRDVDSSQQFVCADYNQKDCEAQLKIVGAGHCRANPFFGLLDCCATCSKALNAVVTLVPNHQVGKREAQQEFVCADYSTQGCADQLKIVGKEHCRANPFFGLLDCCVTCSKALNAHVVITPNHQKFKRNSPTCLDYNQKECEAQLKIVGKEHCRANPFFGLLDCCATCTKALHVKVVIEQPSQK